MFEEMIQKIRDSVRATILDCLHDFISKDSNYSLALSKK